MLEKNNAIVKGVEMTYTEYCECGYKDRRNELAERKVMDEPMLAGELAELERLNGVFEGILAADREPWLAINRELTAIMEAYLAGDIDAATLLAGLKAGEAKKVELEDEVRLRFALLKKKKQ